MSGFLEQYRLQKQPVPPRHTGEAIAVRSTKPGSLPGGVINAAAQK
jgi:hypothetical protein